MKTAKRLSLLLCAIFVAAQPVLAQNGEDTRNKAVMTTDDGEQLLNTDEISIIRFDGPKVTVVQPWGATVFDRTLRSLTFLRPLPGMLRLTVKTALNGDDAVTRGVDINGSGQLAASWKAGDQVYVYPDATTTTHIGTLTPETTSAKTSKLTGDVTATGLTSGQTLYLSTKPRNHSFATQTNSLDDLFYYKAEATVTITGGNASIANASFSMAQSVTRFTLQDGSSNAVNATQLVITGGTEDITVTSTPATNVFYVAMPAKASTVYSFTATTSDSREWTGTKTAALVDGKYYRATVTMTKTKLTVTDPSSTMTTAVEAKKDGEANQTYTGSALQLVTAGVSSAGTLRYRATTTNTKPSKSEGTWTTTVPTATAAGTYYVWYYAEGNDDYNATDVCTTPVTVTIDKAAMGTALTADNITIAEATYNGGTAVEPAVTVTLNGQDVSGQFDVTYSNNTNAGTGTVTVTPKSDSNFSGSAVTKDFAIAKAAGTTDPASTMTTAVTAKKDGDNNQSYTGSAMDLVNAGVSSAGTVYYKATTTNDAPAKGEGWTTTVPTASNAGTYYVWYYAGGNDNYNETAVSATPITVTIDKAAMGTALTADNITIAEATYNGGTAVEPAVTVTLNGQDVSGQFDVTYSNNTNAGTGTVTVTPKSDSNFSGSAVTKDFAIAKAAGTTDPASTMTTAVTAKKDGDNNQSYTGSAMDLVNAGVSSAGTVYYKATTTNDAPAKGEGWTTTVPTASNAGTYYVWYYAGGNDNYNETAVSATPITVTIDKVAPTYTAPTFSALTYTGVAQNLVSSGSSSHGTFTYATSQNGEYSASVPQSTNAGNYTVWYKFTGDENHSDIAATEVTGVSISQKALTITAKAQTIAYGAGIATTTDQVTADGLVSGDAITAVTLTPSTSEVTTSGTITPSAATTTNGIDNYAVTYNTGTLTITAVAASVANAPAFVSSTLTYSGNDQTLVTAGTASGGTMYYYSSTSSTTPTSSSSGWSTNVPKGGNAGTYYVWYYVDGDTNHTSTAITPLGSKAINRKTIEYADVTLTIKTRGICIRYNQQEGSNDKHIHTNAKSTSQGNFLWTLTVPSSCTVSCDKTSGTISTFSVSGNAASGYTLTLTKTGTTSSAADIYTITVNGGGNYTGTYSFTIKLTNDSYGT